MRGDTPHLWGCPIVVASPLRTLNLANKAIRVALQKKISHRDLIEKFWVLSCVAVCFYFLSSLCVERKSYFVLRFVSFRFVSFLR